ncbi:MAG: hypothetical protein JWM45_2336, partial [Pseudonocardiales bacterium]|nr:hypothetical protein [Pseudonocardiales bacterium]
HGTKSGVRASTAQAHTTVTSNALISRMRAAVVSRAAPQLTRPNANERANGRS